MSQEILAALAHHFNRAPYTVSTWESSRVTVLLNCAVMMNLAVGDDITYSCHHHNGAVSCSDPDGIAKLDRELERSRLDWVRTP